MKNWKKKSGTKTCANIKQPCLKINDLSIGSTETKYYIKLNTKTQNIFCFVNENLATYLYTLTGGTRKQKEKKNLL